MAVSAEDELLSANRIVGDAVNDNVVGVEAANVTFVCAVKVAPYVALTTAVPVCVEALKFTVATPLALVTADCGIVPLFVPKNTVTSGMAICEAVSYTCTLIAEREIPSAMTMLGTALAEIVTPRRVTAAVPCDVPETAVNVLIKLVARASGVKLNVATPLEFVTVLTGVKLNPLAVHVTVVFAKGTPIASKTVALTGMEVTPSARTELDCGTTAICCGVGEYILTIDVSPNCEPKLQIT